MKTTTIAFTVYVDSGDMARSVSARLRELAAEHGVTPDIAVVDVGQDPLAAENGNVIGVPTVVREQPPPRRRVIGALDDARRVSEALGLDMLHDDEEGPQQ